LGSAALLTALIIAPQASSPTGDIYIVKIEDYVINPVTAEYIVKSMDIAAKHDAECIIIELDTPGGLLASTRDIVKAIMNSGLPVITYITPSGSRAGSAGVFITLASHVAAMAPSTNIGAAHPVNISEKRSLDDSLKELIDYFVKKKGAGRKPSEEADPMEAKVMNDTVAWVEGIASKRGRNADWAKKSVTESVSITEEQALKEKVIDLIAEDTDELIEKLDGIAVKLPDGVKKLSTAGARVISLDMDLRRKILNVLANPTIAYILLMLGFYGLLFEFTHPGIGFPGIAGAIVLILGFFGLQTIPIDYAGFFLIGLAFVLFIAEVKVQSYGLLSLGGIVSMVLGSLMLFSSSSEFMRVSIGIILSFAVSTALIIVMLLGLVVKAYRKKSVSGKEALIGKKGTAVKRISPEGKVFVHGEIWDARSDEVIKKGEGAEVTGVDGLKLIVRKSKEV